MRLELERIFKCDFTARKKEIDTMVMDYVDSTQNDEESEKSSEEEEEEEKPQKKKAPPPKKAAKKRKANSDSDASSNNDDSGDDYKPERRAAAKKPKKADAGAKKAKGTGRKGKCATSNRHRHTTDTHKAINMRKNCDAFNTRSVIKCVTHTVCHVYFKSN